MKRVVFLMTIHLLYWKEREKDIKLKTMPKKSKTSIIVCKEKDILLRKGGESQTIEDAALKRRPVFLMKRPARPKKTLGFYMTEFAFHTTKFVLRMKRTVIQMTKICLRFKADGDSLQTRKGPFQRPARVVLYPKPIGVILRTNENVPTMSTKVDS